MCKVSSFLRDYNARFPIDYYAMLNLLQKEEKEKSIMSTEAEGIKWVIETDQLQSLYSLINSSTAEINKKAIDNSLKEKIKNFEKSLILLVKLVFSNNIPALHLTRYLILLINQVLSTKNAVDLVTLKITGISKNMDQIVNNMITLHELCQEEVFRTALANIQSLFATDCIVNTEAPLYNLRQQLQLWQLHSKDKGDPQYEEATQQIQKIQVQIDKFDKETEKAKEFCKKYKVKL